MVVCHDIHPLVIRWGMVCFCFQLPPCRELLQIRYGTTTLTNWHLTDIHMSQGSCNSAADHRGGTISIIYSTTVDIMSDVMSAYTHTLSIDGTAGIPCGETIASIASAPVSD